jgi:hypothetical protein
MASNGARPKETLFAFDCGILPPKPLDPICIFISFLFAFYFR